MRRLLYALLALTKTTCLNLELAYHDPIHEGSISADFLVYALYNVMSSTTTQI